MALSPGDPVRTPHRQFMNQMEDGVYERDAPDHVVGPTLDGFTERIPQGTVRYPDGGVNTWPRDAIQPVA